jgi:hypothetical protein
MHPVLRGFQHRNFRLFFTGLIQVWHILAI